jgi:hypothetical protein
MAIYRFKIATKIEVKRRDEIISQLRRDFSKYYGHEFNLFGGITTFCFRNEVSDDLSLDFQIEKVNDDLKRLVNWFESKYRIGILKSQKEKW